MKRIFYAIILLAAILLSSCGTTVKFPVSTIAPAAEGVAKIKKDKNNNYQINLTGKHLANPERLNPPKSQYIVWVLTQDGYRKNVGRLVSDRSNKGKLITVVSFVPTQIFITAEDEGEITWPGSQILFSSDQLDIN